MKILLTEDVDTLGYKGEIFEVADGYGRNYLIPKGFAVPATPGQLKQAEAWREQAAARREQLRQEYAALVDRLADTRITFMAKAGEKGRLYGSITTAEIAASLEEELGIEIDRRKITVEGKSLRETGTHAALVRFDAEFQATIMIEVIDESAPVKAVVEAEEEEGTDIEPAEELLDEEFEEEIDEEFEDDEFEDFMDDEAY